MRLDDYQQAARRTAIYAERDRVTCVTGTLTTRSR